MIRGKKNDKEKMSSEVEENQASNGDNLKKKNHEMKAVILGGFRSMKQGNSYTQILKLFYLKIIVQHNL